MTSVIATSVRLALLTRDGTRSNATLPRSLRRFPQWQSSSPANDHFHYPGGAVPEFDASFGSSISLASEQCCADQEHGQLCELTATYRAQLFSADQLLERACASLGTQLPAPQEIKPEWHTRTPSEGHVQRTPVRRKFEAAARWVCWQSRPTPRERTPPPAKKPASRLRPARTGKLSWSSGPRPRSIQSSS